MSNKSTKYTYRAWIAEGTRRFGDNMEDWLFVCPVCGHVTSIKDWYSAGAPEGVVAFSCVGRWKGAGQYSGEGTGPCNYAGGGLFKLNPVTVITKGDPTIETDEPLSLFDFAPEKGDV